MPATEQLTAENTDSAGHALCSCKSRRNTKNLIVCIDGTSNKFDFEVTNVIKLYRLIKKDENDNQFTWYNSGIGTYAKPSWTFSWKYLKEKLYHKIDQAIAWDFESIVLDAYRWLSDNYQQGDCIFLFGFSRGAYQVRALSAMIHRVGLIHKGNEAQIPFAYELYAGLAKNPGRATEGQKNESNKSTGKDLVGDFKTAFSRNVKVHFVGVWDTVSSVGLVRGRSLPDTTNGMNHVCYFRHALALDERRVKFLPEYAYGGTAVPIENSADLPDDRQHTKEVWFSGTHSDIGGHNSSTAPPPLTWMALEAAHLGLRISPFKERGLLLEEKTPVTASLTFAWKILERIPITHLTYTDNDGTETVWRWHLGAGRVIQKGQKVHISVLSPPGGTFKCVTYAVWKGMNEAESRAEWERINQLPPRDPDYTATIEPSEHVEEYNDAIRLVQKYDDATDSGGKSQMLKTLSGFSRRNAGKLALSQVRVHDALKKELQRQENSMKYDDLLIIRQILDQVYDGKIPEKLNYIQVQPVLLEVLQSRTLHECEFACRFLLDYTDFHPVCIHTFPSLGCAIINALLLPSPERVVVTVEDGHAQAWSPETGQQLSILRPTKSGTDRFVAYSPDGRRAIVFSHDRTVRVWNVDGDQYKTNVRLRLKGDLGRIAFSPEGDFVAVSDGNSTLHILDIETSDPQWKTHSDESYTISCISFVYAEIPSPTSSSDGKAVETPLTKSLHDAARAGSTTFGNGQLLLLVGHKTSPVLLLDACTAEIVYEWSKPITGDQGWDSAPDFNEPILAVWEPNSPSNHGLLCLAISNDGTCIVGIPSVNSRCMYVWKDKLWAPSTVNHKWIPFMSVNAKERIESITFSVDGKHLISGGDNKVIRIWDTETWNEVVSLSGHEDTIHAITVSWDNKRIISCSRDGTVCAWDAEALLTGPKLYMNDAPPPSYASISRLMESGSGGAERYVYKCVMPYM